MPSLSVVIITFNEEKNIARCILSVKEIADDIVVVDSYSTDSTREVCLSLGARFVQNKFVGHIQQKNFAITQALYPHILSLDADEEVSPELRESILSVKNHWDADGYNFSRLTSYCGKWIRFSSWYPSRKLRLWDSRKGRWGGVNPHDVFILDKGSKRKRLNGRLYHYSYDSIRDHVDRINRYTDIIAANYYENGRTSGYFRIFVSPLWRFFRDYFLRGGFLDGFYGLIVCRNSAFETFLKYVKLRWLMVERKKEALQTVCFFNSSVTWGGGEKWYFDISTRIQQGGHKVMMVTNRKSALYERISEGSMKVFPVHVSNLSFLNPLKLIRLRRLFVREKVRSIVMNLPSDMKVAGIAAFLAGVPNIIYSRGVSIPIRDSFLNRFLFGRILTWVIANSEETKRSILANNPKLISPDRIRVIYNGINLDAYDRLEVGHVFERKPGEFIIGNAGRLSPEKGQRFLIDLAAILKYKGYFFKILIAGEGKLKQELVNYAHEKGVQDEVVFLGFVENIKSFMTGIDLFCLTSLWEGFGYVLVEAMACRKPVIAFDVRSTREIIDQGVNGYFVEDFNLKHMAEKIETMINNPSQSEKMGEEGRKKVESVFLIGKTVSQVERLI